jgi:hypothetical protein
MLLIETAGHDQFRDRSDLAVDVAAPRTRPLGLRTVRGVVYKQHVRARLAGEHLGLAHQIAQRRPLVSDVMADIGDDVDGDLLRPSAVDLRIRVGLQPDVIQGPDRA